MFRNEGRAYLGNVGQVEAQRIDDYQEFVLGVELSMEKAKINIRLIMV